MLSAPISTPCVKVRNRMECQSCGYPFSEAAESEIPWLACNATQEEYKMATQLKRQREYHANF